MAAVATLAPTHADAAECLRAIKFMSHFFQRHTAQFMRRDALAAAHDGLIRNGFREEVRPGERLGNPFAEALHSLTRDRQRADTWFRDAETEIGERSKRSKLSGDFSTVCALRPDSVTGEINALDRAAAVDVDRRPELTGFCVELKAAACEVGQLRLRPQMVAKADGVAIEAADFTRIEPDGDAAYTCVRVTVNLERRHASMDRDAGTLQTGNELHAPEAHAGPCDEARQRFYLS